MQNNFQLLRLFYCKLNSFDVNYLQHKNILNIKISFEEIFVLIFLSKSNLFFQFHDLIVNHVLFHWKKYIYLSQQQVNFQ